MNDVIFEQSLIHERLDIITGCIIDSEKTVNNDDIFKCFGRRLNFV